jgi:uncharacterized protein
VFAVSESIFTLYPIIAYQTKEAIVAGKFVLKKTANGQFMFNLKAGNGETILTSEMYHEKSSATAGIESVKKNAVSDANFERKLSAKQEPFFVLKAPNGEIIGKSEMYSSSPAMENGIKSVMMNAPMASIVDSTV